MSGSPDHGTDGPRRTAELFDTPEDWADQVMTPDEAAAYMASHPAFARRVEEEGRQIAERYAGRLGVGDAPGRSDGEAPAGCPPTGSS